MVSVGPLVGLIVLFSAFFALAIPIAILWLVIVVIRNIAGQQPAPRRDPAAEELRYRFARGEITQAQFEDGMRALGYEKRP